MSSRAYPCPQCGAAVPFQSSVTVFAVCGYCTSMVVRTDETIRNLGQMAQLPPDLSPLQIGTRGEWMKRPFQLIGRLRLEYVGGSWNEWYALFSDGAVGWLAEAQGFFMLTTPAEEKKLPPSREDLHLGETFRFAKQTYTVTDIKPVTVIAAEGELPAVSPPGSSRLNADLAGAGGRCGTLEFHEEGTELYLGSYATFESLALRELRPVPGWDAPAPVMAKGAQALNCPRCGAAVELRATGQTQAAVCGSCGSLIDTANPVWRVLQAADEDLSKLHTVIVLGARGKLFGVEWEAIGFQRRGNRSTAWDEYLLFNPWHGFRFLTTWGGHWNFVERVLDLPTPAGQDLKLAGKKYRRFAYGEVSVTTVLGEFYWKVQRGETAKFQDYICPPRLLSSEQYGGLGETTYSLGTYIEPGVVEATFKTAPLSRKQGIFANQPSPWGERWRTLRLYFYLALAAAVALQIYFGGRESATVYRGAYRYVKGQAAAPAPAAPGDDLLARLQRGDPAVKPATPTAPPAPEAAPDPNTVTTPSFKIAGPSTQAIAVRVSAPVDNSWIGFSLELANVATGEVFPGELEVSYYHGSDSDGAWTEGSNATTTLIAAVPPGEYRLELDPEADPALGAIGYDVQVESGGLFASNFFLGLLLICAYPAFVYWRRRAWEKERWAESDFD